MNHSNEKISEFLPHVCLHVGMLHRSFLTWINLRDSRNDKSDADRQRYMSKGKAITVLQTNNLSFIFEGLKSDSTLKDFITSIIYLLMSDGVILLVLSVGFEIYGECVQLILCLPCCQWVSYITSQMTPLTISYTINIISMARCPRLWRMIHENKKLIKHPCGTTYITVNVRFRRMISICRPERDRARGAAADNGSSAGHSRPPAIIGRRKGAENQSMNRRL